MARMSRRLSYYCVRKQGNTMTIVKSAGMRRVKNAVCAEEGTRIRSIKLATKNEIAWYLGHVGKTDEEIRVIE